MENKSSTNNVFQTSNWFIPEDFIALFRLIEKSLDDKLKKGKGEKLSYDDLMELIKGDCKYLKVSPSDIIHQFVEFCKGTNSPLLIETIDGTEYYSFSLPSRKARDYKKDYANARIIIEQIAKSHQKPVDRIVIYEAIHRYLQDKEITSNLVGKDREGRLGDQYADKVKRAIGILKQAHIICEAGKTKSKGEKNVASYIFSKELLEGITARTESETQNLIIDKAFRILSCRMVEINTTYSITKEDEKKRIAKGLNEINRKLQTLDVRNTNDRIVYHWYKCILLLKLVNGDMSRRVTDFITYIRYNNVKYALTEVKDGELYPWEDSFNCWNKLLEKFREEKFTYTLPARIEEEEYRLACNRLLKDLNELISTDDINEDNLSVFYVRATISAIIHHPDTFGYLERLYHYVASNGYIGHEADICLVIFRLSHLQIQDMFEFTTKAKKWLYTLARLNPSHDVAAVTANIYLHLIGITPEDDTKIATYRTNCVYSIESLSTETHSQRLENLTIRYLYILYSIDYMQTKDIAPLIVKLWDGIVGELEDEYDPRLANLYIDTFLLGARYLNEYVNFGVSLPFLTAGIYLWTRKEGIKDHMTYYSIFEALEEFLDNRYEPFALQMLKCMGLYDSQTIHLKLLKSQELYYPNAYHIKNKISRTLLDMGNVSGAIKYAEEALSLTKPDDLSNPKEALDYIDIRLQLVAPYYLVGRWQEADEILIDSENRLKQLLLIYEEDERNISLNGVMGVYNDIMDEMRRHPFYKRELRLEYIIENLQHTENKPEELDDFYEKWKQFYCGYRFHRSIYDKDLIDEFERDDFPYKLEQIANNIADSRNNIEIEPFSDIDIEELGKKLGWAYEKWQCHFIENDSENCNTIEDKNDDVQYPEPNDLFYFFAALSQDENKNIVS